MILARLAALIDCLNAYYFPLGVDVDVEYILTHLLNYSIPSPILSA
jgi:hypothetical protein